jgi:beta-xylosidase
VIGSDEDGDGTGEPVESWRKPSTGYKGEIPGMQESDEFDTPEAGFQWQWHANPEPEWMFLSGSEGYMRLYCNYFRDEEFELRKDPNFREDPNLWEVPNLYLQKFPAPAFTATAKLSFNPRQEGEQTGLVIMGTSYAAIVLKQAGGTIRYTVLQHQDAEHGGSVKKTVPVDLDRREVYLRVSVSDTARCRFSISTDGQEFTPAGEIFTAVPGKWIGAKVGLFALGSIRTNDTGWADYDWFRITGNQ